MPVVAPAESVLPEMPAGLLSRLGAGVAGHARLIALVVLLASIAGYLVAALGVGGPSLFSRLAIGEATVAGEAMDGRALLEANDPTGASLAGMWSGIDPTSPQVSKAIVDLGTRLAAIPGVAAVADPSTIGSAAISTSGTSVLVSVVFDKSLTPARQSVAERAAMVALNDLPAAVVGSQMHITGASLLVDSITHQVEGDLRKGEGISLPLSLLVMVLIFGGFAAAGVPLAGAIASIAGGLAALLAWTYVFDLDATTVNVVSVLGLGLCIDYSLLIVSRYREEIHELVDLRVPGASDGISLPVRKLAMARTISTAGRTVMFSGVTVAISVLGLLLVDVSIIRSVGVGALTVVLIAVAAATTFVPALLTLGTKHVAGQGSLVKLPGIRRFADKLDHAPVDDGAFSRWARRVQRHPWVAFLGVTFVLLALTIPALRMNLVSGGPELLPPGNAARVIYFEVQDQFPATARPDLTVVANGTDPAALDALSAQVAQMPGVVRVTEVQPVGEALTLGVFAVGGPQSEAAKALVRQIRSERPAEPQMWVTGEAAQLVDFTAGLRRDVPKALGFVVAGTFILLFLLTGSVLIPIKALLMNILSLGATLGVLVLLFQDGRFEGLLNYQSMGGIEAILPVIILAFAFGLSMDYEVFLLSRIKEFHSAGLGNDESVRLGLQRTGRIITSAAALIVIVFAGFVLGDMLAIKETGVALAVAVLIDATLVRIILVPATMTLLGEWNWWAPHPLRRLHNRISITH